MKKVIVLALAILVNFIGFAAPSVTVSQKMETYIQKMYSEFDFGDNPMSYNVFKHGVIGYMNLRKENKINANKHVLTVNDMSLSSVEKRMWILDMKNKEVLINTYVAHGQGTGDVYAEKFSNTANSHMSSMGFYVTANTYVGKHGNSLRLEGMDKGYNCKAMERAIVVHGANYVSEDFIQGQRRLGRSWGCPAVDSRISDEVIGYIKEGTVMFTYFPEDNYFATSHWLNNSVDFVEENNNKATASAASYTSQAGASIINQHYKIKKIISYDYSL